MPVFAPLPSNGSVSSSVAGETACPIPNNAIWKLFALTAPPLHQRRSLPRPHQYFPAPSGKAVEIFRNSPKFPLDGLTQMSYGCGSDRSHDRRGVVLRPEIFPEEHSGYHRPMTWMVVQGSLPRETFSLRAQPQLFQ